MVAKFTTRDTHILDWRLQAVSNYRIVAVNDSGQFNTQPANYAIPPQDTLLVGFALNAIELAFALEPRLAAFANDVAQHCPKRPGRYLLDCIAVQVIAQPTLPDSRGVGVQVVFSKAKELTHGGKRFRSLLRAAPQLLGIGVFLASAHLSCPLQRLAQTGVIDLARTV
jgi:hypothetical protein